MTENADIDNIWSADLHISRGEEMALTQEQLDAAILDILSKSEVTRITCINIPGFCNELFSRSIHVKLDEIFDALIRLQEKRKVSLSIISSLSDPSAFYILASLAHKF